MKRVYVAVFTVVTALAVVLSLSLPAQAQNASETLYKSKCAMCHGVDGKKLAGHDLTSADVQKKPDAELSGIISNGKGKMPAYKSLTPEEVKGLVAHVRTLK